MLPADIKKNELHTLVRSLESHEKAYYKKMAKRYADQNKSLHLRLFELLENSAVNDEKLFMKKIGVKTASHFSGLKNHLWNDILSSMVYQQRNDPLVQLQFIMLETETLLAKNLIASAEKLLDMAWATAYKYELYGIQIRIIHEYYKILPYSDYKHFKKESERLLQLQRSVFARLHCEQQLQILRRELIAFKQFTYLRCPEDQLQRIREIEAEVDEIETGRDSPLLLILHHFNKCAATHLSFRFEQCSYHVGEIIALWQAFPHYISYNSALFLSTSDYCFYNAFALKDPGAAARYLSLYNELAVAHLDKKEQERWEVMAFHTRLKIYHKNAQYDLVAALVAAHGDDIMEKANRVLPPVLALSITCSLCITYFVLQEYDKAEDLLIDVNNTNRDIQREDLLYFTSIFYLLILLEKKAFLQLNNAISANYFKLYNKKKLQPFEKDLMLFLKHLTNEPSEKEQLKIIKNFIARLEDYRNDPVKDLYFLYFNYYGWLESKIQKIGYTEYMYRKVNAAAGTPA
jgi:hypothetical protein